MDKLDELAYRIHCAREFFRPRPRRDLIESVHQLVDAAAATGSGLTLNAPQAQALRVYLDSVVAMRETRVVEQAAAMAEANNILPFAAAGRN
jgi:hypothetical protein